MKKVAGTLKIDQAQFRELEAFAKFGSDMDPVTAMIIENGRRTNTLLVQAQYSPVPVGEQVAILYCGINNLLRGIPLDKVKEFETLFLDNMRARHKSDVLDVLAGGEIDDNAKMTIEKVAKETAASLI